VGKVGRDASPGPVVGVHPAIATVARSTATFNTALLPLGDEQVRARRVEAMAPYLAGYDLLVLQEAFATGATERLLASIDEVYPYRTEVLAASDRGAWPPTSGGVLVASQWPIVDVQETRFGAVCSGTDCLADKGFVFVTVDVDGANLHLIATHLQSEWGGEAAAEVRARQADLIAAFVDAAGVPASEPLLIAGDLNVVQASDEAGPFFDRLRATVPPREGPLAFTWDPLLNPRAYGDREWIDYVTWSTDHLEPDGAWQRALVLRDGSDDLSDHYAVWGRLTFSGR
jgi:sphingomyelin phosphodiesterase